MSDEKKGASIVATVTIEVNKTEILKKMGTELPNIALPKQFIIIRELPMMSTGKIDFRTVTRIVQEIINGSGSNFRCKNCIDSLLSATVAWRIFINNATNS